MRFPLTSCLAHYSRKERGYLEHGVFALDVIPSGIVMAFLLGTFGTSNHSNFSRSINTKLILITYLTAPHAQIIWISDSQGTRVIKMPTRHLEI